MIIEAYERPKALNISLYLYNHIRYRLIQVIKLQKNVLHYPRLDTVLMVEKVLQEADLAISKNELLRRLPKQIMRPTLNVILLYLETKGHVMTGEKGILWIHNDNPKMKKLLAKSIEA